MRLCLALQMLCRCSMQMQKADADCRTQMQIAELHIRKHSAEISNGLRARGAGPDLIAHAHSAGPGTLDRGPLAKESSARKRDQHDGNIASKLLQNGSKMVPTWLPNGPLRPLGGLLGASWGPLKALKKAWSAKGGLPGTYGALLDGSLGALGGLRG